MNSSCLINWLIYIYHDYMIYIWLFSKSFKSDSDTFDHQDKTAF